LRIAKGKGAVPQAARIVRLIHQGRHVAQSAIGGMGRPGCSPPIDDTAELIGDGEEWSVAK
jgi:hypothetical protein